MTEASRLKPWLEFYGDVPASLEYPPITLYEAVRRSAAERPDAIALDFLGSTLDGERAAPRCARLGASAGSLVHRNARPSERRDVLGPGLAIDDETVLLAG